MSSNFLGMTLVAWRDDMATQLNEGLERAKKMTSLEDVSDTFLSQYYDDGEDVEEVREELVAAFEHIIEEYLNPREADHFNIGTKELMYSAGMSWGDAPTEVFDSMCKVMASGLYYGDRLSPERKKLKVDISAAIRSFDGEEQDEISEGLDTLVYELFAERASDINNSGWEKQLDFLFEEYDESVEDMLDVHLDDDVWERVKKGSHDES